MGHLVLRGALRRERGSRNFSAEKYAWQLGFLQKFRKTGLLASRCVLIESTRLDGFINSFLHTLESLPCWRFLESFDCNLNGFLSAQIENSAP